MVFEGVIKLRVLKLKDYHELPRWALTLTLELHMRERWEISVRRRCGRGNGRKQFVRWVGPWAQELQKEVLLIS